MRIAPVLLLLLPALGVSGQANDPAVTVRNFLAAWASGDVNAAATYWTSASGDFDRQVRRPLTSSCITLHGADVGAATSKAADVVEVPADLRYTRRSMAPKAPIQHLTARALLQLRRDGGEWRIEKWREAEEQFVDELVALATPAERRAYLDAHMGQWTPALVRVLTFRALDLTGRSQHPLAREATEYAARVAVAMGDDASASYALSGATTIERSQPVPNIARSLALANEAVTFAERSGDPNALAFALVRLGRAGPSVVEPPLHERVLALDPWVDDQSILAQAAAQLAQAHGIFGGNYRRALADAELASRYADAAPTGLARLAASIALGNLYRGVGDSELAALHYDRASKVALEIGYLHNYASLGHERFVSQLEAGHSPEQLLKQIDETLALPPVVLPRNTLIDLYRARSRMHTALGQYDAAEADLGEAIALDPENRKPYQTLSALRMLEHRYASAKTAVELGPRIWHVEDWTRYIESMRKLGELDEAVIVATCAIEYFESQRPTADDRHLQTYLARRSAIEQNLMEMLVERGKGDQAFAAAEAHKARILRDIAGRTRAAAPRPAAEEAAERAIVEKVETMNRAVYTEKDPARLASLRRDLALTRLELDDLRARFAANVPGNELHGGATRAPRVRWPFRDVTALHYAVGKERTLIFVVRAGSAGRPRIDVTTIDITGDELKRLAGELRDRITTRDLRYATAARRLYDVLIAPVEKLAGQPKTLCIIPDGELWKVPFHALIAGDGRALLERAAVFYAPSMAMLEAVHVPRAASDRARLLALGNPTVGDGTVARFRALDRALPLGDLAEAESEVRDIARLYGRDRSRVYLRGDAREAVFKESADEFDVVHVAAHGVLDNEQPRYSALVLAASSDESEDGLLEAHEVAELRLTADLVVLSACETAAGKVGGGEGILGLSWAFLAAGADGLVGSQWKAPSAATEQLMVAFHERLVAGDTPAEALRHAQRRLMRDERYASPLDWAPFIIVGDGL